MPERFKVVCTMQVLCFTFLPPFCCAGWPGSTTLQNNEILPKMFRCFRTNLVELTSFGNLWPSPVRVWIWHVGDGPVVASNIWVEVLLLQEWGDRRCFVTRLFMWSNICQYELLSLIIQTFADEAVDVKVHVANLHCLIFAVATAWSTCDFACNIRATMFIHGMPRHHHHHHHHYHSYSCTRCCSIDYT